MLRWLKPAAIVFMIAVVAVAVVVVGAFLGTILLVLSAVAIVSLILVFLWKAATAD